MKINNNGTVTDETTNLTWQQITDKNIMNWNEAIDYCRKLNIGNYTNWRLPTIHELKSLVNYSKYDPAIDTNYFSDTISSFYWSSTVYIINTFNAWGVYFYNGNDDYNCKDNKYYVRAVRR